jgi:hypothetical protein
MYSNNKEAGTPLHEKKKKQYPNIIIHRHPKKKQKTSSKN